MAIARPSYELAAGTNLITTNPGALTFVLLMTPIGAPVDSTITCYDQDVAASIATTNKMCQFGLDTSVSGFTVGGNITHPIRFSRGLVVVTTGAGAVAYVSYTK